MKRQFCTFGTLVMALFLMSLPSAAKDSKDVDTDKDGVIDRLDKCPKVPGPKETFGCPFPNRDGDGLKDSQDKCPLVPGPVENNGCPWPDQDKDGIPDRLDKCPKLKGSKSNAGCPRPKVVIRKRNCGPGYSKVYFKHGKSDLTKRDEAILIDGALKIMKKHRNLVVLVEGHTSSKYAFKEALKLSKARAKTVRDFLIKHGIAAGRLKIRGYGYTRPINSNRTEQGRARNERVDFLILSKKWKPKAR